MSAVTVAAVIGVRDGVLAIGAFETVAEALEIAGAPARTQIVVIGSGTEAAADALATSGFGDVPTQLGEIAQFQPARIAHAVAELVDAAHVVILPNSNDGRDLAPRLAVLLNRELVSGAVRVEVDKAVVTRAAGTAMASMRLDGAFVATLQPSSRTIPPRTPETSHPPTVVPAFAAFADVSDITVMEVLPPEASTMDLADATFIMGAGAGLGSQSAFEQLGAVAHAVGASVGATRVVTDIGWATHERQIGTTGVVVDPRVYVAFGISGAVQHTSGLGHPDHVIAVNTDQHCPMMAMADLAIVADAPAVVAALAHLTSEQPNDSQGAS